MAGDDEFGEGLSESEEDGDSHSGDDQGEHDPVDLPADELPQPWPICAVTPDQLDGALPCDLEPPGALIAPMTAWAWTGPPGEDSVLVTPLVANRRPLPGEGEQDQCIPPILASAGSAGDP